MKEYDPSRPLIFIHLPKTAGTSVRKVFAEWYREGLLDHYYDSRHGALPVRHDLEGFARRNMSVCIYGHFNRRRGFGLEDYYPEVNQFITILRDPFDQAVSAYYFLKRVGENWADKTRVPQGTLEEFLIEHSPSPLPDFFPEGLSQSNFEELIETHFIEIGVVEHLEECIARIAQKIDQPYAPNSIPSLNAAAERPIVPPGLRQRFSESNELLYDIYNYVLAKYGWPDSSEVC